MEGSEKFKWKELKEIKGENQRRLGREFGRVGRQVVLRKETKDSIVTSLSSVSSLLPRPQFTPPSSSPGPLLSSSS